VVVWLWDILEKDFNDKVSLSFSLKGQCHELLLRVLYDSHRVVVWLWDILEKDFNDKVSRILSVKGQCLEIFIIVSIQLPSKSPRVQEFNILLKSAFSLFGVSVNPLLGWGVWPVGGGGRLAFRILKSRIQHRIRRK
jgi:hypothetical protein